MASWNPPTSGATVSPSPSPLSNPDRGNTQESQTATEPMRLGELADILMDPHEQEAQRIQREWELCNKKDKNKKGTETD